jgi:hypothetical protein
MVASWMGMVKSDASGEHGVSAVEREHSVRVESLATEPWDKCVICGKCKVLSG